MTTQIEIQCDDDRELLIHLSEIRRQVKARFKKFKREYPNEDGPIDWELKDSNCYGDHIVTITEP